MLYTRSAVFWGHTQHRVVVLYRLFWDSLLMPSSGVKQSKKSEDGTDSLSQTVRTKLPFCFFHSHTMHLDIIKVLLPTDARENCLEGVLKFTLKQLRHVSV